MEKEESRNESEIECCNCIFNAMCTTFEKLRDNGGSGCDAYISYICWDRDNTSYSWLRYVDDWFNYIESEDVDVMA